MSCDRRVFLLACLLAAPVLRAEPAAVVVEGQRFERHARVAGRDLVLNGTGVRAVAWFKGYAAALYLTAPAGSAAQALALPGPKRLQMRMLREVPAAEFVKAMRNGVERNAPADELPQLLARMQAFEARIQAVGTVRSGDVVDLDLEPALGMRFALNGTLQGEPIAGDDFFAAVLRGFIGDRPYDARLKRGLLGQPG